MKYYCRTCELFFVREEAWFSGLYRLKADARYPRETLEVSRRVARCPQCHQPASVRRTR